MSKNEIFSVKSGVSMPNIPMKTWDNGDYWDTLSEKGSYRLQQNRITKHSRILDSDSVRIAWGSIEAMSRVINNFEKPWKACKTGDILAVQRVGGLYWHYAVYIGRGKVIHYSAKSSDFGVEADIHKADFKDFLGCDSCYEILQFHSDGTSPDHKLIDLADSSIDRIPYRNVEVIPEFESFLRMNNGYKLFSPSETVERAKSRLGENKYNLTFNNCEHFAIWCKTGLNESIQVEDFFKRMLGFGIYANKNKTLKNKFAL